MMRYMIRVLWVCLFFLLICSCTCSETATEIEPAHCTASVNDSYTQALSDDSYFTVWYAKRGNVRIELPENQPAYSMYICFNRQVVPIVIQIPDGNGGYSDLATVSDPYLHQVVFLPGVTSVQIRIADESKNEMLRLAELHFFGLGELPSWVQQWKTATKADLLLISGHPDDELLWYGGTLPYYACERNMCVQVMYLAHGDTWRENELLDGLWMCGVRDYPIISEFPDVRSRDRNEVYRAWGGAKKTLYPWYVEIIRKLKPEVVLTHDLSGEYGHAVHQIASYLAINCFSLAAEEDFAPESAAEYGTWQVKKLYVHLYPKNQISMDWDQPLESFDGKTGMEIADAALECHKSQQPVGFDRKWRMPYDCRAFGLYYTTVGPDVLKNDFLENIY